MKTFTHCAEKKAKQILNLLQGYTKGIRITAILILLLMGVSNAWAKFVYLTPDYWWKDDNARFAVYAWKSSDTNQNQWYSMVEVESDLYIACIDDKYDKFAYCRMNPNNSDNNWDNKWNQTIDLSVPTNENNWLQNPSQITNGSVYLIPNSNWKQSNARFAAYFFGNGEEWVDMKHVGDGIYECQKKMDKIILCRMNPSAKDNNWDNKWNQTSDLTYPTNGNNLYTVKDGTWDKGGGTWSATTPKWSSKTITWDAKYIYLKPNVNWKQSNARFAAYVFTSCGDGTWIDLEKTCNGDYYRSEKMIPANHYGVIFCRMNPSTDANNWNNKWNQTGDLIIPTDGKNLFTVPSGAWDGSTTTWETAPTYNITVTTPSATEGTINVSPATTVNIGETVTVTIIPNSNYKVISYTVNTETTPVSQEGTITFTTTICSNTTISAKFELAETKYTVNITTDGNGTVSPSSVEASQNVESPQITATANEGYTFKNWTATDGITITDENNSKTTIKATKPGTLTANFTANKYTVKFNANGGTGTMPDQVFTYDDAQNLPVNKFTRTGYDFVGWATSQNGAVAYADQESVSNLTSTNNGTVTLYAIWTANQYDVTLDQQGGTGGTTSVQATYGSAMPAATMPKRTGYTFGGYYTAINGGGTKYYNANGSSANNWDQTSATTLYAKWTIINYTITYNLDGGENHADNPDKYTVETPTITLKDPTKTGYTFNGWYSEAGFINKVTEIATGSTGNKIFYAKWTENTVTISPTNAYDHGNPGYANPTASNSGKIGISSTSQLVAPSPGEGYTFVGWTLSDNIVVTNGNASSSRTITVRHKTGDGSAVSAVANYNENLDSHWHLVGDDGYVFPDQWGVSNNNKMQKRSGYSSEKKVYMTITVSEIKTYEFKVVDDNGNNNDIWYGYSSGNNFLEWTETSTKDVYTTTHEYNNDNNLKFTPNAVGDYEFKVDYSGNNPKVTITYPEVGSVSSYRLVGDWGNGWDATGIAFNAEGKVSLELEKRERPDYTFKVKASNGKHYTAADEHKRQFTRQHNIETISDDTDYPVDDPHNLQLQADAKGTYIFEFDPATKQLKVTHPEREDGAYLVGDFSDGEAGITDPDDSGKDWTEEYGETFDSNDDCTHGVVEVCDWGKEKVTLNFRIKINGIWYGFYHEEDADPLNITTSGTYTLEDQYAYLSASNVQLTTNGEEGCYYFEYTVNPDGTLSVLIIFPNDRRTVTFDMQGHGTPVEEQRVLYNKTAVKPYVSDVDGYLFAGWYTDEECTTEYDFNTPVTKDITLYAKWIPYGDCVFFKNNLNWDEVYVYFYSSDKYWTDDKGTGAHKQSEFPMNSDHRPYFREFRGKMTRIGLTDIWYFDYISAAKQIDPTYWAEIKESKDIAFTAHEQHGHSFFDNTKVIRRGDFKPDMQLFVPQTDQTPTYLNKHDGVSTRYYNKGLWMIYNSTKSGYNWSSDVGNWDNSKNYFTSEIAGGYSFTAEVELNAGSTYEFKIHNQNGTWFGKNGTMTQDNCTNWWFKEEVNDNAKIKPTVTGTYIFTAYLGDGKVMISLDYPLSTGDYRLAYLDNTANSFHPGHYLKKRNENKLDTVSFFIHHDREPQVIAQRCTDIDAQGNATWETITSIKFNPAAPITESGVYNFTLEQLAGQTDPRLLSQAPPYTGDYYIRTDAAPGGWKSFRQIGNMMTYNSYADEHEDFDHYFCEWVSQEKGLKNVKYTVANDYSYCISDTLKQDVDPAHPIIVENEDGDLPIKNGSLVNANVRWGWDSKNNKIRRAYMAGSGHKKDRFLVLEGNESLLDVNGNRFTGNTAEGQDRYNLTDDEVVFDDMGNWIYQMDVKANKETEIDLTALYNGEIQYFKGGSANNDELQLIVTTDDNTNYYKIRLIYDFKINQLIIAWLPDETDTQELKVNMMIIRHNQEQAQQINFKEGAQLTGIEKAYAVMTFDKYFLNNKNSKTGDPLPQAEEKSENERKFYWISFPFDVKLSDVSGFGEYGDYWIMEYYDGESRAKEGYWAETETFWKYITNKNYILKAGQGYVLYLNLNKMKFESNVFAHTSEVSLYFPSLSLPNVISGDLPTAVDVPEHTCTIERDNRNIYDSNWNLIGVPGFADISGVTIGDTHHKELNDELNADCVSFYYKYLPGTNTYSATTQTEIFQTMYAYMVQFAGTINWQAKTMPAQLAARRTGSTPSQYDLRLELAQGEETDQTFVQLKEADATAEFDMNVDMTKIFNSGMNIYTLTGSNAIQVAGNAIPMGKATVPVGVRVDAAGEYTFRMPDGTDGIAVTLVDNATGTHTNMLMSEYTVTLNAGTIENRFYLVVDPDRTATSVENIGEEAKGDKAKGQIKKFLIDGKLFIRTADGIFDAKGQRL